MKLFYTRKSLVVFTIIVTLQILVIISITLIIIRNKSPQKTLGDTTVSNPLPKREFNFDQHVDDLEYFYEPDANNIIHDKPEWLSETAKYTINSDTLNERVDYDAIKTESTFRVITLGDSFTFGQHVNTEDNWTELLEDKLSDLKCKNISKFEVINLGVIGYDAAYVTERYKIRGIKYNPDLIIWFESGTGISKINELIIPMSREIRSTLTQEYIKESENRNDFWPEVRLAVDKIWTDYSVGEITSLIKKQWSLFLEERASTPVLIATFPYVSADEIKGYSDLNSQANVYFFNKLPDLRLDNLHFQDYHPNYEGHKQISDKLFKYLLSESIIHCDN